MASPTLANLYLHYVLDLWVDQWRRKEATGDVIIVRNADDAVLGFQHRKEAEQFLEQLRERLRKFGLELHPEKTRLIEFGRYAAERREKRGKGKPETFNFLAFTHICGTSQKASLLQTRRETTAPAGRCRERPVPLSRATLRASVRAVSGSVDVPRNFTGANVGIQCSHGSNLQIATVNSSGQIHSSLHSMYLFP